MRRAGCRISLVLLCFLLSLCSFAQDDDRATTFRESANLSIDAGQPASTRVQFIVAKPPADWAPLTAALAGATHCPATAFHHPSVFRARAYLDRLSEAQRQQIVKAEEEVRERHLVADCPSLSESAQWMTSAHFDLNALTALLKSAGVESLTVTIRHPDAPSNSHSARYASTFNYGRTNFYEIPTAANDAVIDISYGYNRRALQFTFGGLAVFLLVPFLLVLWMRSSALRGGPFDSTGAWFNYMRGLNLVVQFFSLLWIVGRLNPREEIAQAIQYRFGGGIWTEGVGTIFLFLAIPAVIYLVSLALSYRVYIEVRGLMWSRWHFYAAHAAAVGAIYLPLMFILSGIVIFARDPRIAIEFVFGGFVASALLRYWKLKLNASFPQPVTTGELRDKVFDMARRVGVPLKHVLVISAGKANIANAFAARKNIVLFTDYLLQRLNKREVDAVVGHELTHLRHRHPLLLQGTLIAVLVLPGILKALLVLPLGFMRALASPASITRMHTILLGSNPGLLGRGLDFVIVCLGLTGFYFLARRFERTADRGAVLLTGDAEAMITSLLKIGQLNLIPVQWSRASSTWATHPSTRERVERIAREAGISDLRLQELISTSTQTSAPEDHYDLQSLGEKAAIVGERTFKWAHLRLWALIAYHVLPACLLARVLAKYTLPWQKTLAIEALAIVLLFVGYIFFGTWIGSWGAGSIYRERRALTGIGFAPSEHIRFYTSSYVWDRGRVVLASDRLVFIGRLAKFALPKSQVLDVQLGAGPPSWVPIRRVYVTWRTAAGQKKVYQFSGAIGRSFWASRRNADQFLLALRRWKGSSVPLSPVPPELAALSEPAIGEVTSLSPRAIGGAGPFFKTLLLQMLPAVVACCIVLRVSAVFPIMAMLALRIFELIPYWRFSEPSARPMAKPATASS